MYIDLQIADEKRGSLAKTATGRCQHENHGTEIGIGVLGCPNRFAYLVVSEHDLPRLFGVGYRTKPRRHVVTQNSGQFPPVRFNGGVKGCA